jgi:hypothetical protein
MPRMPMGRGAVSSALLFLGLISAGVLHAAPGGFLLAGSLGPHFYGYDETDDFGPVGVAGDGGGTGLTYQVSLGGYAGQFALYATFVNALYAVENPGASSSETDKSVSLLCAAANLYLAGPPGDRNGNPYLILGAGSLFHKEDGVYMGRGPGFLGGLGLELMPHVSLEIRYMGGVADETGRELKFNSLQVVLAAAAY